MLLSLPCFIDRSSIVTPHPSEANFIAPGKRPLSAMSPIIVTHKASGRLVALAGASGGPLIVSATLQTLARCGQASVCDHSRESNVSVTFLLVQGGLCCRDVSVSAEVCGRCHIWLLLAQLIVVMVLAALQVVA